MFNDDYDMTMEMLEQDLMLESGDTPLGRDLLARTAGRADARAQHHFTNFNPVDTKAASKELKRNLTNFDRADSRLKKNHSYFDTTDHPKYNKEFKHETRRIERTIGANNNAVLHNMRTGKDV